MKYVVSLIMMVSLLGCTSVPGARPFRAIPLEGVVYTGSGVPLRNAEITLDGHASVWSDISGRFTIPHVRPGEHRVHAQHDSHEAVEMAMTFARPSDVLYLRLRSAGELARASQRALDRGGISEAEELIARALAIDPDSIRVRYLAAIVYTSAGRFTDARRMLDHRGFDSTLPAVRLLLERISRETTDED